MTYKRPGVYINERLLPAAVAVEGTANAAGAAIGAFAQGPTEVTLVTSWYDFVRTYGGYNAAYPATFGVGMFFRNGGSELYVRRAVHLGDETLANNAVQADVDILDTVDSLKMATVTALSYGAQGNNYRIQLDRVGETAFYNLTVYQEGLANESSSTKGDIILERFTNVVFNDPTSGDYIETVVNLNSRIIAISADVGKGSLVPVGSILPLTGGNDGATPVVADYLGLNNSVLTEFENIERPLIFFVPEVVAQLGATDAAAVNQQILSWAEDHDAFVVIDTDQALDGTAPNLTATEAITYASGFDASSHGAVYYPNFYITDPLGRSNSSLRKVAPAGAIAGLYLATDRSSGPFKAPAGVNATIRGAVALEKSLSSSELDALNGATSPVNAIRNLPGAGIVAMGARTLLQDGTANRYVNMRRSLIYIRRQLQDITTFAIFENNDERLWARLRTAVGTFLNDYRNQGGLRGANPEDAYFVKCDAENNDPNAIANGEVHIEVGVALQYPAEFIVINLSQKTGI